MNPAHSTDALEHLHNGYEALRDLLVSARMADYNAVHAGVPSRLPEDDLALRAALPELRRRLTRTTRMENEVLYPALLEAGADEACIGHARTGDEILHRLLERAEHLASVAPDVDDGEAPNGNFRDAFDGLVDHLLQHIAQVETILFPLAHELSLDLQELGERMREQLTLVNAPAARHTRDGRLDVGSAEDRSPDL